MGWAVNSKPNWTTTPEPVLYGHRGEPIAKYWKAARTLYSYKTAENVLCHRLPLVVPIALTGPRLVQGEPIVSTGAAQGTK